MGNIAGTSLLRFRTPDPFGELAAKFLPGLQVGFLEICVGLRSEDGLVPNTAEIWIGGTHRQREPVSLLPDR